MPFATAMTRFIVMDRRHRLLATECIRRNMELVIDHVDHLVLTVADIDATVGFYSAAQGMEVVSVCRSGDQEHPPTSGEIGYPIIESLQIAFSW